MALLELAIAIIALAMQLFKEKIIPQGVQKSQLKQKPNKSEKISLQNILFPKFPHETNRSTREKEW